MITRLAALAALLTLGTAPSPDPLESQLTTIEKQSWVAWKARDGRFFQDFLSDDHVEVGNTGIATKAQVVAEQDTKCNGAPVPSPTWVSSLYVLRNGKWQNALYQHSGVEPAPPA